MLLLPHLADNASEDLQALGVVKGKAGSRDTPDLGRFRELRRSTFCRTADTLVR